MNRSSLLRLRWLAGIMLPAVIILLTTWLGGQLPDAGGPSPVDRMASLVSCVLPAAAVEPAPVAQSAAGPETDGLNCAEIEVDALRTAWITAC